MKKAKLALLSMLVITTVFCLTSIFHIQLPFGSAKDSEISSGDTAADAGDSMPDTIGKPIQSFSIDQFQAPATEPVLPVEETEANLGEEALNQDNDPSKDADASEEVSGDSGSEELSAGDDTLIESDSETETEEPGTDASTPSASDETPEVTPTAPAVQPKYADIGISVAKDYVNIRKEPSTNGDVLGKLYRDSACRILNTEGEWYYVESGTVTGYVKAEYVKTGLPDEELIANYSTLYIIVDVDGLNVRAEKSTESKKLTVIYQNEKYPVKAVDGEWLLIDIEDENIQGYVMAEFAEQEADFKHAVSKEEEQKLLQIQAEERAKKETQVIQGNGYSYTTEDLKLLACLVHAESGTQSYEGKLAVANVVLNRMKSSKYPDTIKAVIYQSGQFSVAKSGSLEKQLNNYANYSSKSQKMSIKAAKDALEGMNNIGKRMYFHTVKAASKKGYTSYSSSVVIQDHLFW